MGLVLLAPSVRPADIYLSAWRQRTLALWSYVNQTVKLAGAFAVKLSLHTHCSADRYGHASAHGSCKVITPRISSTVSALGELTGYALFHTLSLISATAGGLGTCSVFMARDISSSCIALSKISGSAYPALATAPSTHSSLFAEGDRHRRVSQDGADLLYLYYEHLGSICLWVRSS